MLRNSYFHTCLLAGAMLFLLAMQTNSTDKNIESETVATSSSYMLSLDNKGDLEKLKEKADKEPSNENAQLAYAEACFAQKGEHLAEAENYFQKVLDADNTTETAKAKSAYALACLAVAKESKQEGTYLATAYKYGFRDYQALLSDPNLEVFRQQYDFLPTYADLFSQNQKAMFEAYLGEFPKWKFAEAYQVQAEDLYVQIYSKKKLNGVFNDFAPGVASAMFGRRTTEYFHVEEELAHTKNYKTIIYSNTDTWTNDQSYLLVTYTPNGELIDKLTIAQSNFRTCTTAKIEKGLKIELNEYNVVWKNDIRQKSDKEYLAKDDIKQLITKSSQQYTIDDLGKIILNS